MTTTTATALPATGTSVPNLDWTVASIKSLQTSCGEAYTASLRYRGSKVATIEHDGRGGVPMILWNRGKTGTLVPAWEEWVAEYEKLNNQDGSIFEPEYDAIVALMDEHEIAATLRKASRQGIPLLPVGTKIREGGSYALAGGRSATNPVDIDAIRAHRSGYDRYWDGQSWVAI